jgi:hypothetical protein
LLAVTNQGQIVATFIAIGVLTVIGGFLVWRG